MQELDMVDVNFLSCVVFFCALHVARCILHFTYANRASDIAYELSMEEIKKGASDGLSYFELADVSFKSIFLFSISFNRWSFKSAFPEIVEAQRGRSHCHQRQNL